MSAPCDCPSCCRLRPTPCEYCEERQACCRLYRASICCLCAEDHHGALSRECLNPCDACAPAYEAWEDRIAPPVLKARGNRGHVLEAVPADNVRSYLATFGQDWTYHVEGRVYVRTAAGAYVLRAS